MKQLFTLFILLFFVLNINAQDWKIISTNGVSNFYNNSSKNYHSFWIDSADVVNGDSVFYLNKIIDSIPNTSSNIFTQYDDLYLPDRPYYFLSELRYDVNNVAILSGDSSQTYFIKTRAGLNETWLFDTINNIEAKVVGLQYLNVLGEPDSIKTILLNGNRYIELSKKHGIIRFPILAKTAQDIYLVGLEAEHLGDSIPMYLDFFDFGIGDEFYYKKGQSYHWASIDTKTRIIVLDKVRFTDSIKYIFKISYNKVTDHVNDGLIRARNTYIDTVTYVDNDSSFLNKYPYETVGGQSYNPVIKRIHVEYNVKYNTVTKRLPYFGFFYSWVIEDTLIKCNNGRCASPDFTKTVYGVGLGQIYERYYNVVQDHAYGAYIRELIGYKRNNIVYGDSLVDALFMTTDTVQAISYSKVLIYPNPIIGYLRIEIPIDETPYLVTIYDVYGRQKFKNQLKSGDTVINTSSWAKGMYIVVLKHGDEVETRKTVKY